MALLQFSLSPPSTMRSSSPSLSCSGANSTAASCSVSSASKSGFLLESPSLKTVKSVSNVKINRRYGAVLKVRSSLDIAGATVGQVTEVNKDTFWPIVEAAGDKTVVLDMYTQWCGPCKVMAPKFQELSEKYLDVVFLKLDCNQENKVRINI
ncbi:Thioredoxin [Corchorus capsularis]|uniref:Thioredoxin n=1 Tax=Corchorus capsularis TaxID=210143 RepID=A0A1R3HHW1_COCAP|nr:Thioredoxin [Corchorus capsularis]